MDARAGSSPHRIMAWRGAAAAIVLVLGACHWWGGRRRTVETGPPDPEVVAVLDGLDACPHYMSHYLLQAKPTLDSLVLRANHLSGALLDIPEYNDCQRLPQGLGEPYGPLAAVFASKDLARLVADQAVANGSGAVTRAIAAASVQTASPGYDRLGLMPGTTCLYLWRESGGAWQARAVPVTDVGTSCRLPLDVTSGIGTPLDVVLIPGAAPSGGHPAVARWGQDTEGFAYVEIRCGNEWCAMGRSGFAPAPPVAFASDVVTDGWIHGLPHATSVPALTGVADLGPMAGRGWYDVQYLAPVGGGTNPTNPSPMQAFVVPHPALDGMNNNEFDGWQAAAFIWIPAPPDGNSTIQGYTSKFNLRVGWNAISLCQGVGGTPSQRWNSCAPGEAQPTCSSSIPAGQRWFAMITAPNQTVRYFCVHNRPHAGPEHVIGTARWRWLNDDETVWVRCKNGCCEAEP